MKEIYLGVNNDSLRVTFAFDDNQSDKVAIYGKTGGGKSVALEVISCQLPKQGFTGILFDTNGSHTDDQMIEPFRNNHVYLNEIDASKGIPIPIEYIRQDGGKALAKNIAASVERVGVEQRDRLISAVRYCMDENLLQEEGIKAIDEALELDGTKSAKRMREKLEDFTESNVIRFGPGLVQEGKLTIIHLSELPLHTQRLTVGVILGYLWNNAQRGFFKKKPIILGLDEIHSFKGETGSVLGDILSEGRKFGMGLVFATQTIGDFKGTTLSHRISQAAIRLIFRPADDEVEYFAKSIDSANPGDWVRILKKLGVGQCVVTGAIRVDGKLVRKPIRVTMDLTGMATESNPKKSGDSGASPIKISAIRPRDTGKTEMEEEKA